MDPAQEPPDENIAWHIYVGTIVTIVPATIAVILRFISRHVARAGLWLDDYTIAIALAINWVMAILRWVQILVFGVGRHAYYLPDDKIQGFFKSFLASQIIYFLNAVFTKAALLLLYYRIFGVVKHFRWALCATWFLVIGYFIACTIVSIAECLPVAKFWNPSGPGSCIDMVAFFRWNGVTNLILDVLVLCLPFPMAWRLQMTTRQKLILTGIFMLGGFVCIVSVMRIASFDFTEMYDPTWTGVNSSMYSSIEQSVGIICACLPTLRPLFRSLYGPSRDHSNRAPVSSSSSSSSQNRHSICPQTPSSGTETSVLTLTKPSPARTTAPQACLFDMEVYNVVDRESLSLEYGDGHQVDRCVSRVESMV
ncbi:hypothetical protein N7474_005834 [Penicillium riverlandense]|uniref:uncharacterized protein n=1 Tax=Penicillium riverlandense TaxID=1903569 RepID=UPI0025477998|nr:uncharacterized protein N7474_005834 [Penicillium riverlandense]KAJ5820243.1 hypothetical protein N7474_005834 [Penicillium riverlandense]